MCCASVAHNRRSSRRPFLQLYKLALQALWLGFAPDVEVAHPESWQLFKLGMPVSPLDVVVNGSHNMHAVSDEGVAVTSRAAPQETLYIR